MSKHNVNIQEAVEQLVTLRDFIRWAVTQFNQSELDYGHGTDNSWDEAVHLVLSAVHLPIDSDANVIDGRLTRDEREKIADLVRRRVDERTPVPYLINEAWFAGLPFYVDKRVIVPRSPIAELIEEEFSPWVEEGNVFRILDLCTGSGCIGISAAIALPNAIVDAVDISQDALDVALINVKKYELEDRVHLIKSDVFENVGEQKYDIIVSNPPYVGTNDYNNLPSEYHHEPKKALEAGADGLLIVKKILQKAENYLTSTGILIVEVGLIQDLVENTYPDVPFTWLQFERGGEGVFLLTAEEIREFRYQLTKP